MIMQETDLKQYLEKYRGYTVDFFIPQGNVGDSLIGHGAMTLFQTLDIKTTVVNENTQSINDVLLINGGGGFIALYSHTQRFIEDRRTKYKEIILLPSSIYGDKQADLISLLDKNFTIFCREKISYAFVKKHAVDCNVYLWHDLAFYYPIPYKPEGTGVLNAFREDKEKMV